MILDALQMFDSPSSPKSLALAVGTHPSTNVLDYGIVSGIPSSARGGGARDLGIGDRPALKLFALIGTTATSGGAGTLQLALQGAQDDGTGNPGAYVSWWFSKVYALGDLVAGARLFDIDFPRPPSDEPIPRYIRMAYIVGTADLTGGTIMAGVVIDRDDQARQSQGVYGAYPAGINVAN